MLRLPPEIRNRIYDHLFGSIGIHILARPSPTRDRSAREYRLSVCQNICEHVEVPRRYMEHYYHPENPKVRGCTLYSNYTVPVTPLNIGLSLLQTSRQIYHEAVLKPFSETRFQYNAFHSMHCDRICGLQKLTEALAPPQAKAIARLRLIVRQHYRAKNNHTPPSLVCGVMPGKGTIMKLKGLKDVEIVLAPHFSEKIQARRYLSDLSMSLSNFPGIIALSDLRLRTLRVTVESDYGKGDDIYNFIPTFYSRGEVDEIENWLRHFELKLHVGFLVDTDREPMPPYAIKQNDDAIRIPSWSTDEEIKKAPADRRRRKEIHRLENEEFQDIQERRIMNGHLPIWTLDELQSMAESARIRVGARGRNGEII